MRKDNKGYSLVELIIVIAIMALLTGTAFFSINMIFGAGAKACANDIKEALAENKVTAMGKSGARVEIYRDASDDCVYAVQWIKSGTSWEPKKADESGNPVPEKLGNSRVYVSYTTGGTETELTSGSSLMIGYDRSNGSFTDKNGCTLCEKIYVKGGSRSYELTLIELTGKVELVLQ
ncbi:MAG: prepilin-type N-terminal cleavage/methylation domain-containing protein [Lachnospiraceae bacterium]|nr:prepilin-type N-terminal cleavage/methylation domain-containing protein [Lachnospiraceae bacterium]